MAEEAEKISFVCQRCLQPLRIDPSFYSMSEHTLAELSLPLSPAPDFDLDASSVDKYVPPFKLLSSKSSPNEEESSKAGIQQKSHGFTLVGESGQSVTLGHRLRTTVELFDIVSNNSDVDHPLCEECTDTLLESMDQQLRLAEDEAQEYQAFLQKLEDETEDDSKVAELQAELEKLKTEEKDIVQELDQLRKREEEANKELAIQKEERAKLEREEHKYWKEYSRHKRQLLIAEDDFKSLDCQLRYAQVQMEKLKKANVFNATFHIWHTGHFATINGFRYCTEQSEFFYSWGCETCWSVQNN